MSEDAKDTGAESVPHVLVSPNYLRYDDDHGWLKAVHSGNPRFAELKSCVDAVKANSDAYPREVSDRDWRPSLISFDDALNDDFSSRGYSLAVFCGGLHGGGDGFKWLRYLDDIRAVVERIIGVYGKCWVVDVSVHDDVYYVTVGIEDTRTVAGDASPKTTMHSEMVEWDSFVTWSLDRLVPLGIIDWGYRDFDWAWSKIARPYGWPVTAFSGSLFHYRGCYNDLRVFEVLGRSQTGSGIPDSHFFRARSVKEMTVDPFGDGSRMFFVRECEDEVDDEAELALDEAVASGRSGITPDRIDSPAPDPLEKAEEA